MSRREEPSPEIILLVDNGDEEEPLVSCREKKNFSSFRAVKESLNDKSSKSKPLIQRVPPILRENKNLTKYFEPRVVAIGPLHHGNARLQPAEEAKLKFAVLFTKEHGVAEEDLYKNVKEQIEDLKKFYVPGDIQGYDDEELAWMLFVDGCAVLHAINHHNTTKHEEKKEHNDIKVDQHIDIKVDLRAFAQVDLFMLENQLPFRVLKLLMSAVKKEEDFRKSIIDFVDEKIKSTIAEGDSKAPQAQPGEDHEHTHLLGLLRERLLADVNTTNDKNNKSGVNGEIHKPSGSKQEHKKTFRSINELKEAGIHVCPSKTSSLRDVNFNFGLLGSLKIPRIVVDDSTGSKFMNLVAYEMCPDFQNDFGVTSYLCFLDTLIDTAQDVKELRHAGMLLNYMGSDEEVADLFNKITNDLVPNIQIYKEVMDAMSEYCNNACSTLIAKAYYTHFSTPWSILAFLGALIGLIFTAIQAYYSIRKGLQKK